MILNFETVSELGQGQCPDILQFYDTSAQLLTIENGELTGTPILPLEGSYETPVKDNPENISPDNIISNFSVNGLNGFGAVGSYLTDETHKLIIYEYAIEMDRFLEQASIRHSISSPINSMNMSLANPIDEGATEIRNVAISERESLISPGSKVTFLFQAGDSEEYEMGEYYVDRSNFTLLQPTIQVDGRNLIGKALSEQTLDENTDFPLDTLSNHFKALLTHANISSDQYLVEDTQIVNSFVFDPTKKIIDAINEMLKATINWKIEERQDGTIIIGSPTYSAFIQSGVYTFKRDTDIFSRSISRDDMQSYRRVCVHTGDFTVKIFKEIQSYTGWNLQANKTLYIKVPDGTREAEAFLYASEVAVRLEKVGKVETFNGPFRPYLNVGDRAIIQDIKGNDDLGTITELSHTFGRNGYSTQFVVDSGGRIGKGQLSEYINVITRENTNGTIGYAPESI